MILASRGATPGPFPMAPVLVFDLGTVGSPVGTAEWTYPTGTADIIGRRSASLIITGYGSQTFDWIEELALRVEEAPPGVCISPTGDTVDVSALQETGIEQTYSREFVLYYTVRTSTPATAATSFPFTVTNGNP